MVKALNHPFLRARLHRVGRAVYWRLPPRWRDTLVELAYRRAGPLFRGIGHYEAWRRRRSFGATPADYRDDAGGRMIDPATVAPARHVTGRSAIHAHVFYPDLAAEFARSLRNMPFPFDLFVSVVDDQGARICRRAFVGLPQLGMLRIEVVPNRGRDIAPMLCTFGPELAEYDFIAHIHTKKSIYNRGATGGWREYLVAGILGSEDRIRRVFGLLQNGVGMVYPQTHADVPYVAGTWLANRASGMAWCRRLGVSRIPSGYFDFPVGSMFWARTDVLRPLFESGIKLDDFEPETGQTDGTLAHVVERLLGVLARDACGGIAILRDEVVPSWSPWRFDQFVYRGRSATEAVLGAPDLSLVIVDIFDTLLVRPLVEPERIKAVIARRAGPRLGEAYLQYRAEAECAARARSGRDVGLDLIGVELGRLAGLDQSEVAGLVALEGAVEMAAVSPRPGMADLLRHARRAGKRVVLASDMYLPADLIEAMLTRCGMDAWDALYVSSGLGMRKDSGALFDHILTVERAEARQTLVVGDNERSDFQIPADRGMRTLHMLRPVELARGHRRFAHLIERIEPEPSADPHLALGLIVRRQFATVFFGGFDPHALVPEASAHSIGYSVLGPIAFAFAQWLARTAASAGVRRLYFLAREGQFLQHVYERATAGDSTAPTCSYLVVSRRAVNVPAIRCFEDVVAIAATYYGPHTLEAYLLERFGLDLGPDRLEEFERRGLWRAKDPVVVRDGCISHLEPLLRALLPEILAQAARERPGLEAYLRREGIDSSGECGVVDIGYSGTIQRRLNALLGGGVHGFYLATDERIREVADHWQVRAEGCFHDRAPEQGPDRPVFLQQSFIAEKLLSSDDPQIVRYDLDECGQARPEYTRLTAEELGTREVRARVRDGAVAFVDDAQQVRSDLLPDFVFPPAIAMELFAALVEGGSPTEQAVVEGMILDDHYCGRGLVA